MERIVDRSREFVALGDMAIVTTRKLLEEAVNNVSDGGTHSDCYLVITTYVKHRTQYRTGVIGKTC